MAGKPKVTDAVKALVFRRYMSKDASVAQLAREYRVSQPAIYQWIEKEKTKEVKKLRAKEIGSKGMEDERRISKDLELEELRKENAYLRDALIKMKIRYRDL